MSFLVDIPGRPVLFSLKGNGRKIDLGERRGGGGTVKSGEIVNCCPSMRKEQKGKKYKSKTIINKSLNNFLKKKHRKQDLLKWNRSLGVWPLDYILSLGPYFFCTFALQHASAIVCCSTMDQKKWSHMTID